jgi:hypothetical protein
MLVIVVLASSHEHPVRWDSARSRSDIDPIILRHAACLKADHNHLLIIIHRPSVAVERSTAASTTSLAICMNAARANARIFEECALDIRLVVSPPCPVVKSGADYLAQSLVLGSAHILLFGIWGADQMGLRIDRNAVWTDVRRCSEALAALEPMYLLVSQVRFVPNLTHNTLSLTRCTIGKVST